MATLATLATLVVRPYPYLAWKESSAASGSVATFAQKPLQAARDP